MMATPETRTATTPQPYYLPQQPLPNVLLPAEFTPRQPQSQLCGITIMPAAMQATSETTTVCNCPIYSRRHGRNDSSNATITVTPSTITVAAAASTDPVAMRLATLAAMTAASAKQAAVPATVADACAAMLAE